jgi:hypothetical protein
VKTAFFLRGKGQKTNERIIIYYPFHFISFWVVFPVCSTNLPQSPQLKTDSQDSRPSLSERKEREIQKGKSPWITILDFHLPYLCLLLAYIYIIGLYMYIST